MSKSRVAEELAEKLQNYSYEVDEGEHDNFYDDYILDELLEMREHLHEDGTDEGRFYQFYTLTTNKRVKLYETIETKATLSGDIVRLKVMAIDSVIPLEEGKMIVEFLAKKLRK